MTRGTSQVFRGGVDGLLGNAWGGHQSLFGGRLILKGENPLGSKANLVTARENRPRARASQLHCPRHRKRESQHYVHVRRGPTRQDSTRFLV